MENMPVIRVKVRTVSCKPIYRVIWATDKHTTNHSKSHSDIWSWSEREGGKQCTINPAQIIYGIVTLHLTLWCVGKLFGIIGMQWQIGIVHIHITTAVFVCTLKPPFVRFTKFKFRLVDLPFFVFFHFLSKTVLTDQKKKKKKRLKLENLGNFCNVLETLSRQV